MALVTTGVVFYIVPHGQMADWVGWRLWGLTNIEIAPFKWILEINDALKNAGAQKYGEPPYDHAELSSLKVFAATRHRQPS